MNFLRPKVVGVLDIMSNFKRANRITDEMNVVDGDSVGIFCKDICFGLGMERPSNCGN